MATPEGRLYSLSVTEMEAMEIYFNQPWEDMVDMLFQVSGENQGVI